jgi:hypothetical protein
MGTSHDTGLPDYFPILVRQQMPSASNAVVETLQNEYYDASNLPKMAWDWTTDVVFACTANNLANALPNVARRYIMSTPPAVHGQDLECKCRTQHVDGRESKLTMKSRLLQQREHLTRQ